MGAARASTMVILVALVTLFWLFALGVVLRVCCA